MGIAMVKVHGERRRVLTKGLWWLVLVFLVFTGGCWDRRELENLAVVVGIGINLAPEGEGYEVSSQIVRAAQIQSPGGSGSGDEELRPFWILRSRGPTVLRRSGTRRCKAAAGFSSPITRCW